MEDEMKKYTSSLNFEIPHIDEIIKRCIDKIWCQYDVDDSGYLDRAEAKLFVVESIKGT